jgi:hypothetical protein
MRKSAVCLVVALLVNVNMHPRELVVTTSHNIVHYLVDQLEIESAGEWKSMIPIAPADPSTLTIEDRSFFTIDGSAVPQGKNSTSFAFTPGSVKPALVTVRLREPVAVPGICKEIRCHVRGNDSYTAFVVIVRDIYGTEYKIPADWRKAASSPFSGWKEVTASVPNYIAQADTLRISHVGIEFAGFEFVTSGSGDPVVFDLLTAVTDVFDLQSGDADSVNARW